MCYDPFVFLPRSLAIALPVAIAMAVACSPIGPPGGGRDPYRRTQVRATNPQEIAKSSAVSYARMKRQVNLKVDMVRKGTHGRKVIRPMRPRYITIHSTQNYRADAARHSLALKRGALRSRKTRYGNRIGYLIWHFTVDDRVAIQHMPTNEQGEHADYHGPGNRLSIGIEMCEQRGSNRSVTIDRTAKLTALLMKQHGIPIQNVVPHYHWPRRGRTPAHKNCPHFLLDNGRPGKKWRWFVGKVNAYYKQIR